jgi:hypothetical protein
MQGDEAVTLNLSAEETLFVRFNDNKVRQNTDVKQITLALQLQGAGRTTEVSRNLSGNFDSDRAAMQHMLDLARDELAVLPSDPHQVPMEDHGSSDETFRGQLLAPDLVVDAVVGPAQGSDLAGFYAAGSMFEPTVIPRASAIGLRPRLSLWIIPFITAHVLSRAATPAPTGSPRNGPQIFRAASICWH